MDTLDKNPPSYVENFKYTYRMYSQIKSKNVELILPLKTRGSTYMRVFIWSTTCPGLPMKVDGRKSGKTTGWPTALVGHSTWVISVSNHITQYTLAYMSDALRRRGRLATITRGPTQSTHLLAATTSSQVAVALSRRHLHTARCSATAMHPVRTSPQRPGDGGPARAGHWCQILTFLTSNDGGRIIFGSTYMRVHIR